MYAYLDFLRERFSVFLTCGFLKHLFLNTGSSPQRQWIVCLLQHICRQCHIAFYLTLYVDLNFLWNIVQNISYFLQEAQYFHMYLELLLLGSICKRALSFKYFFVSETEFLPFSSIRAAITFMCDMGLNNLSRASWNTYFRSSKGYHVSPQI